ncbi:AMP-dependent synthetase/ligase [Streptomyces sp. E5N91]|uniref:AMP-dependent synthetase/ligase n=1 Tax=Streptomyces sp. E5N91 TaxID=1851996 RepID=UPI000EF5E76A|nr:AMP-dependent synthetase/ligase [Streptomyces sp. E5N91]
MPSLSQPVPDTASLCAAFQATVRERPEEVALTDADGGEELTWAECAAEVERLAGGLAALGVGPGDTVALLLSSSVDFTLLDTAAMHLGAVPWSVYPTSSAEQVRFMLSAAATRVVLGERALLDRLERSGGITRGTPVEHVLAVDEGGGGLPPAPAAFGFEAGWRAVGPRSALTIIWTSGTTGNPKPVELSHGAMTAMLRSLTALSGLGRGGRVVSYLPTAHVSNRWMSHYWWMVLGMRVTCLTDGSRITDVLPRVRPTFWGSVPRVWEKLRASLEAQGVDPARLTPEEAAAVRERIGLDRARFLVVGASPLRVETLEFYAGLGLPLTEVWGMSETCGVLTANPPTDRRAGTVGVPLSGAAVRLEPDGEVLVRGPQLMTGYRGRPDLTTAAVEDGWLRTGDLGSLDADGYLTITGRKKDLFINEWGKNLSPVAIEAALTSAGPLIGQACVLGEGRPSPVALLAVDPDAVRAWAAARGLGHLDYARLTTEAALLAVVGEEVSAANARLSGPEQVGRWYVTDTDWVADSDELTPTMKLRRARVAEKYAKIVDDLYR